MMKVCSKCGIEKDEGEFGKDKNRKDGLYPQCKACVSKDGAAYYKKKHINRNPKPPKWTREKIIAEALRYETRQAFIGGARGATAAARRTGIWDEVCSHMTSYIWTYDEVIASAKKYETRLDWHKGEGGAYGAAFKKKQWFEDATAHMICGIERRTKWNRETVITEALKYNIFMDFIKKAAGAYNVALRLNILDEVTSHMKKHFTWDESKIRDVASICTSKKEFVARFKHAHMLAGKLGILGEITAHMDVGKNGFNHNKKGIMYYIKLDNSLYKIGITNKTVAERFKQDDVDIEVLKTWEYEIGYDAFKQEQKLLQEFAYAKYRGEPLLHNGNTELFTHDVLLLDC